MAWCFLSFSPPGKMTAWCFLSFSLLGKQWRGVSCHFPPGKMTVWCFLSFSHCFIPRENDSMVFPVVFHHLLHAELFLWGFLDTTWYPCGNHVVSTPHGIHVSMWKSYGVNVETVTFTWKPSGVYVETTWCPHGNYVVYMLLSHSVHVETM